MLGIPEYSVLAANHPVQLRGPEKFEYQTQ